MSMNDTTIINDGESRYPVLTADLFDWISSNGELTSDNYAKFCDEVDDIREYDSLSLRPQLREVCIFGVDFSQSGK